jgi:DNA-binding NtrC family response regulator
VSRGAKILIADDEANLCQVVSAVLRKDGYEVLLSQDGEEALNLLKANSVDVLITDVVMRKVSGIELLRHVREAHRDVPVIMMTAYGTIKTAVDAIKLGAFDYLPKPFDMEEMKAVVRNALEQRREWLRQRRAEAPVEPADASEAELTGLVGSGEWFEAVSDLVRKVARSRATVLVRGESGTGKELVARAIHDLSDRHAGPFVAVACAALSSDLLESELFGHERGAFTDAIAQRAGRFELADRGTLFLDEIGDISINLQLKLLRVLQMRQFERVGGAKTITTDVRLVAATNRDLEAAVAAGRFREDLYYRLQVVQIALPPLRERKHDLPPLVEHFLRRCGEENGRTALKFSKKALGVLQRYHWPGNVRELENSVERAVVLAEPQAKTLDAALLPPHILQWDAGPPNGRPAAPAAGSRGAHQAQAISAAVRRHRGDLSKAALALGMTPRSVSFYLRKHGLAVAGPEPRGNGRKGGNRPGK